MHAHRLATHKSSFNIGNLTGGSIFFRANSHTYVRTVQTDEDRDGRRPPNWPQSKAAATTHQCVATFEHMRVKRTYVLPTVYSIAKNVCRMESVSGRQFVAALAEETGFWGHLDDVCVYEWMTFQFPILYFLLPPHLEFEHPDSSSSRSALSACCCCCCACGWWYFSLSVIPWPNNSAAASACMQFTSVCSSTYVGRYRK